MLHTWYQSKQVAVILGNILREVNLQFEFTLDTIYPLMLDS